MTRLGRRDALLLLAAPALMLWLDWHGLRTWFHQDDFAWLALARSVDSAAQLWRALFEPAAQGTVRVWSERVFFLALERLFGLDHRPFHLAVLATQTVNLGLLYWITLRLSASRLAATAAPVFWVLSPGLAVPLAWLSAYNQVLCGFFLLAAFACLLRWLDTGRKGWFAAQAALFVLGFGALEVNVVYPALASAWCWLERRRVPRPVWWLWLPAAAFVVFHLVLIPKPAAGVYAQHWDLSILKTYATYWTMALGGGPDAAEVAKNIPARGAAVWLLSVALLGWLLRAAVLRERLAVFGFLWFTVVLSPVLPLRDHVSDYYLALPTIGVAWMLASMLAAAGRAGRAPAAAAAALAAVYALYAGSAHRATADWRYGHGLEARYLVTAMERARELHRGNLFVVSGIDSELFWGGFHDGRLLFRERFCLDPAERPRVVAPPGFPDISAAFCSPAEIAQAFRQRALAAYQWLPAERRLRATTRLYVHRLPREWRDLPPARVAPAEPWAAQWLGQGWHQPEPGGRWTARSAELTLAAPDQPGRRLRVSVFRPASLLASPVAVRIRVDGTELGRGQLDRQRPSLDLVLPLPEPRDGWRTMRVAIEAEPVAHVPGDVRELGVFVASVGWE